MEIKRKQKQVEMTVRDMYRERGQQLAELAKEYAGGKSGLGHSIVWEPTDGNGNYVGRFQIVEYVPEGKEADAEEALTNFAQKDPTKGIVDPPLWAKAWDWLTKTKG
jgi:hypothetical protein